MTTFTAIDRPAEPRPGMVATLPEVLLPVRWWRGVPARQVKPVRMPPMERFTLELALTMGRADPNEFVEITNLPPVLLPASARRLVSAGALAHDHGGYIPLRPAADQAAQSQAVRYERRTQLDIVLLPRTGDVIALGGNALRDLDRARPRSAGNAPVPAPLRGRSLADLLNERLPARAVPGAGDDIIGVAQLPAESPTLDHNGLCPVYRCTGELCFTYRDSDTSIRTAAVDLIRSARRKVFVASFRIGDTEILRALLDAVQRLRGGVYVITSWTENSLKRDLSQIEDLDDMDTAARRRSSTNSPAVASRCAGTNGATRSSSSSTTNAPWCGSTRSASCWSGCFSRGCRVGSTISARRRCGAWPPSRSWTSWPGRRIWRRRGRRSWY